MRSVLGRLIVRNPVKSRLMVLGIFGRSSPLFLIDDVSLFLNHLIENTKQRFVLVLVCETESVRRFLCESLFARAHVCLVQRN